MGMDSKCKCVSCALEYSLMNTIMEFIEAHDVRGTMVVAALIHLTETVAVEIGLPGEDIIAAYRVRLTESARGSGPEEQPKELDKHAN